MATHPDPATDSLRPTLASNVLLFVIIGFIVVAVAWAALAELNTVTRGVGRVIPSLQLQKVANLEGGIVSEILVRQGDAVERGEVLLRLDPTQLSADFGKGEEGYNALVARMQRLQSEVQGGRPSFDERLARAAPDIVAAERSLYLARQSDLSAAMSVARARLDQAQRTLAQSQVEVETRRAALDLAQREIELVEPLVEKGIEPQIALLRAQSALTQARGEHEAAQVAVQRARASIAEAQGEIRSVRERFLATSVDELTQARGELAAMDRTLPALEDRVERTEVRAPIGGTVNRVLVNTVGGIVRPGDPLVEIVPREDTLLVEARISPKDIGFIRPGQEAMVKITAYDFAIYGGLEGRVQGISPDAVLDDQTGESYYLVRVATGEDLVDSSGRELPITPGMVADIDILGEKRSVLSYLLAPLERVRDTAFRER